eukprot:189923_1
MFSVVRFLISTLSQHLFFRFAVIVTRTMESNQTHHHALSNNTLFPNATNIYTTHTNSFCSQNHTEINCNDVLTTKMHLPFGIDYYYFNLPGNVFVTFILSSFRSNGGQFGAYLALFDLNCNEIDGVGNYGDQLFIESKPQSNEYLLGIYQLQNVTVEVICDSMSNYIPIKSADLHSDTCIQTEIECEDKVGTSLATIISYEDMTEAMKLIHYLFAYVSIGLFKGFGNLTKWQWIDGTSCNYTDTGSCDDDIHWGTNQPADTCHNGYKNDECRPFAVLMNGTLYDAPFLGSHIDTNYYNYGILCNAPNGKYSLQNCSETLNCWKNMHRIEDSNLLADVDSAYGTIYNYPAILKQLVAYWNSTLFVIGADAIHYTNMKLVNENVSWDHMTYNDGSFQMFPTSRTPQTQRYAQYKSSLYFFVEHNTYHHGVEEMLAHIDLNSLNISYYNVAGNIYSDVYLDFDNMCLSATDQYVYVYSNPFFVIFNVNTTSWELVEEINEEYSLTC